MALGAAPARAQGLTMPPEAALSVADAGAPSADNGVRAAPSGVVTEAALSGRSAAAASPPAEPPAPVAAPAQTAALDPAMGPEARAAYGLPAQAAEADSEPVNPDPLARQAAAPPPPMQLASNETSAAPAPAADPPPMQQHVAFPRRSVEAASAFDRYMHNAAALSADLGSGASVKAELQTGASYDAGQLEEGMIAYGAMAALQEPGFVYAVMDAAADERTRQGLAQAIIANPAAVIRLGGADAAAARAAAAIAAEATPVISAGRALKQASYGVQHQGWSKIMVSDAAGRLATAKALSNGRLAARDEDVARLLVQISTLQARGAGGARFTPVAVRSLALAALSILGAADAGEPSQADATATEPVSRECLKLAKLNLFQCLSVAGPEYEDVYCLGQHAVLDTGQCVAEAGGLAPAQTLLVSALPTQERPAVMIPIAGLSRGPVQNAADR